jgi:uncharacterized membrane protein
VTDNGPAVRGSSPDPESDLPPAMTRLVSLTLRVGVGLSAVLAIIGIGLLLGGSTAAFAAATVHGAAFTGVAFASGLARGQAVDVLLLAFLVLILTPLFRVVISVGLFARVGDRPFTALTLTVLLLLAASVAIGALA